MSDHTASDPFNRSQSTESPKPVLSLTDQLKISKSELNSPWAFSLFAFWCIVKKSANGTVGMMVAVVFMQTFTVTMIAMGWMNLHRCPADVYIPIFIMGWGIVGTLKLLCSLRVQYIIIRKRRHRETPGGRNTLTRFSQFFRDVETHELSHILSAAVFAASVGLGYMTYRTYGHWSPDLDDKNYCSPVFYLFAFYTTTVILCLLFITSFLVFPFTGVIVYHLLGNDMSYISPNEQVDIYF